MNKQSLSKSGCSQPPTFYQSLSYLIYFPNVVVCFLNISILEESVVHFSILGILTIISLYFSTKTTCSIPTDKFLLQQYKAREKGQMFDYDNCQLDSFCDICEAYVLENTKHCKHCNRCCQDFDHHCKWVNNCIGQLNYKVFMIMVISTFFQFTYTIIIYARIIEQYQNNYNQLLIENQLQYFHYHQNDLETKYILSIIMLIDSIIFTVLLLQLLLFHLYIIFKGITTYEYITQKIKIKVNPGINIQQSQQCQNSKGEVKISDDSLKIEKNKTIINEQSPINMKVEVNQEKNKDSAKNHENKM